MIDYGKEDDVRSITEDDLYMYNKILYSWNAQTKALLLQQQQTPLDLSHLSLLTDSEMDDGSVHLSNDHYCSNIGSGGHYSESQTNTSHTSRISSILTESDDDA